LLRKVHHRGTETQRLLREEFRLGHHFPDWYATYMAASSPAQNTAVKENFYE